MQGSSGSYFARLLAILGVVASLSGLIVMLLLPGIKLAAWGVLALGVALLAVAFVLDFRRVTRAITGRRGLFGAGTGVMAAIFVGIIIFVNAVSITNYRRFDITALGQFTLTSKTKEVLADLDKPVEVLFFYGVASQIDVTLRSYAESLLNEYANESNKLTVRFIDTDEQPELARQNEISNYSTSVFKSGELRRVVFPWELVVLNEQGQVSAIEAENAFTSAILEVTGAVQKKVYFLTGHGEAGISSNAAGGYNNARRALLDNLFQVGTLDLAVTPQIAEDAAGLIIAGPQEPLTTTESDILKRYLADGGWVMLMLNPNSPQSFRQLIEGWGVKTEEGIIIDSEEFVSPNKEYPKVPRTRFALFLAVTEAYFPGATAIIPQETPLENLEITPLAYTSRNSWLEKEFGAGKEPVLSEGVDVKGPLALGVLIAVKVPEKPDEAFKDTRLIVFGDSDFASNQHFFNGDNGEVFIKAVNVLTTGKELISIERKVLPFRRMLVTQEQANFITYSSVAVLPLLVLLAGAVIWWRRR
ncbi:MAG: Gldg family protein [Chloroflexi bacterium]|nr:Gldg family protein [Chloroflexota bacterium]